MSKFLFFSSILAFTICFGCQSNIKYKNNHFRTDIPHDSLFTLYPWIQKDIQSLRLEPLEGGFDSLVIRFWIYHSVLNPRKVIIIKKTAKFWEAQQITYHWFNPETHERLYKVINTETLQPKSSWLEFIKTLKKLGIERIPDHNVVKGADHGLTDGIGYCIEYTTNNSYRFFHYHCPYYFKNDFQEAYEMTRLIDFVINQFNLTFPKC